MAEIVGKLTRLQRGFWVSNAAGTIVRKRQILGLDVLRFSAALLVMWYHLAYGSWTFDAQFSQQIGDFSVLSGLGPFAEFGWIGVDIFFVISGYVIAFSAESSTAGLFLESRVLRLIPGAWICATLSALFMLAVHDPSPILRHYLRTALFFPASPYIVGAYWTLWIEISFYAVILLLLLANKFRHIERAVIVIGLASSLLWFAWVVARYFDPGSFTAIFLNAFLFKRAAQLLLLEHGCFFAIGTLLWAEFAHGSNRGRMNRGRMVWLFLFGLGGIAQIAGEGTRLGNSNLYVPAGVWLLSLGIFAVSVRWNDSLSRSFRGYANAIRNLGLATYPLYLIQTPIAVWVCGYLHRFGIPWGGALPLTILLMVALSLAITLYPERMLRTGLRRFGRAVLTHWMRRQQATRLQSGA
jgi:peptidoglycan/LPS O-acetylase OafA/YrhL